MSPKIVLHLDKGERRNIQLEIYSCKNEPFSILDASYEITDTKCDIVTSGKCLISGHVLSFMYHADKKGHFTATITFLIADEIMKEKMVIHVL